MLCHRLSFHLGLANSRLSRRADGPVSWAAQSHFNALAMPQRKVLRELGVRPGSETAERCERGKRWCGVQRKAGERVGVRLPPTAVLAVEVEAVRAGSTQRRMCAVVAGGRLPPYRECKCDVSTPGSAGAATKSGRRG